ncbi:Lin0512 family protein [Aestuariicoccus sp. MJ-SS9]|uniref:Lin0512 family protein n=1 Tax=Aestuariicoccus sp. MJ-SS9 TaxID=3079855 RepID=UPI0029133D31|nr:Lin0512 family protein [Aestuariicoccus sp. MJ-SS9]MDU8911541.1 Lin0512 family protein [Aestuariicoccus sp. MJ-SS9]
MRLLTEFGMGSSLRRGDYTEAARRGLRDALWRNSINAAELMGRGKDEMVLSVRVGVQNPGAVDKAALAAVFPYGQPEIEVVPGGLDIPRPEGEGNATVIANVSISVSFRDEVA